MRDSTTTWKQWVQDFKHGRTHVAYALMVSTGFSAVQVIIAPALEQKLYALVILIASLGSLIDTVAHLYYH